MARKAKPATASPTVQPAENRADSAITYDGTHKDSGDAPTATTGPFVATTSSLLPVWFRGHRLPPDVAEPVEQVFREEDLPEPLASVLAFAQLARGAESAILAVRREHDASRDALAPSVFVQNVLFRMRSARDEILRGTCAAHVPIVNGRLDAMIATTKTTLSAFMQGPLNRILCDNPLCKSRGRHLLPGPWNEAIRQSEEAFEDVVRLITLLNDPPTCAPSYTPEQLEIAVQSAVDRALRTAARYEYHRPPASALVHGAAHELVARMSILVEETRSSHVVSDEREGWRLLRHEYAAAAVIALELKHRITPEIREKSRSLYAVGTLLRVKGCVSECSAIEVVQRLGDRLLRVLYPDSTCMPGPKPGQSWEEFLASLGSHPRDTLAEQIASDWESQRTDKPGEVASRVSLDGVSLEDLSVLLTRESDAVVRRDLAVTGVTVGLGGSRSDELQLQSRAARGDEYQPASWFVKQSASWLRKAAANGRKTKKVRRIMDAGTPRYHVGDVRKWRADLIPKGK